MGMVAIESVLTVLNSKVPARDLAERSLAETTENSGAKTLTVKNLSYQYADADEPVLKNVSFSIEPGKKVGILGSIGSGKSTLVNCINHHLDVEEGNLFWGDEDVTLMPRQSWRSHLKTITQEPYLFSDTIEENIRFGSGERNMEKHDVDEVIKLSQLQDDVARFEQGDQTIVGEKGIMLSGGQKQRLSIARALLSPSNLIIMDNVLSAVDYDTERKILSGLLDRIQNQSVLIVSHRISALESMDEILVLEAGEIIARGSHETLLESSEYYRNTWQLQQNEAEDAA
jgi:ATP-binding cassette subfamily B protein